MRRLMISLGLLLVLLAMMAPPAVATEIAIDPDVLPGPGTAFAEAWATVDPNVVDRACVDEKSPGSTPATCEQTRGSSTSGDNWAQATARAVGNMETGDALLSTNTNVVKCAGCQQPFGAAAAYAQFGWSAGGIGALQGLGIQVLLRDGLTVIGNSEPGDGRIRVMVTDLGPREINLELVRAVLPNGGKDLTEQQIIKLLQLPEGWAARDPRHKYLDIDVEVRGDRHANPNTPPDVNKSSAEYLCPADGYFPEDALRACAPSRTVVKASDFRNPCGTSHEPKTCQNRTNVHKSRPRKAIPIWVDLGAAKGPVHVAALHCRRQRLSNDKPDAPICQPVQLP